MTIFTQGIIIINRVIIHSPKDTGSSRAPVAPDMEPAADMAVVDMVAADTAVAGTVAAAPVPDRTCYCCPCYVVLHS